MTEIEQMRQDLSFVRQAIGRRSGRNPIQDRLYLVWAVYSVMGFSIMDVSMRAASIFFLPGFAAATAVNWYLGKRFAYASGEFDHDEMRRKMLHFWGGVALALAACVGLQCINPWLRGFEGAQLCVVFIGLIYFFAGVHFDGYFLILGPVVMAGGIFVGFVPYFPWTCLGLLIAAGLAAPSVFGRRSHGQIR